MTRMRRFIFAVLLASVVSTMVLIVAGLASLIGGPNSTSLVDFPAASMPIFIVAWPVAALVCGVAGFAAHTVLNKERLRSAWRMALLVGAVTGAVAVLSGWMTVFPGVYPLLGVATAGALAGAAGGLVFWRLVR